MDWINWMEQRFCEPSTWAGIGCGMVGVGVICQNETVVFAGIVVGGIAMLIREKGKK